MPVRLRQLGERRFSVTGTPTDAVMMALAHVMKDSPPDLILSGINRGANLAEDVTYSGTVSAAMEGALAGVRSIALSQAYAREGMGDTVPFAAAEAWAERVLAPAARHADGAANADQRQLPGACRPKRSKASASAARAFGTTGGCGSSSAPIRAAMIITGSGWPDGPDARTFHRSRGGRRRLCLDLAAAPRPDARGVTGRVAAPLRLAPAQRPRSPVSTGGGRPLVDEASQVDVALHELVESHWRAGMERLSVRPALLGRAVHQAELPVRGSPARRNRIA